MRLAGYKQNASLIVCVCVCGAHVVYSTHNTCVSGRKVIAGKSVHDEHDTRNHINELCALRAPQGDVRIRNG